jgi:3',5'-cyclic AMP phosphodiesterase CpdA
MLTIRFRFTSAAMRSMSSRPNPDVLTVAHLSDPHLTTLENARPRALLNKRLLGYLSWWRRRRLVHDRRVLSAVVDDLAASSPDQLVVTGDLTHIGLPEECAEAAEWLDALATRAPLFVVLGNHDRYTRDDPLTTVERWRDYLRGDDDAELPSVRVRGRVALIGVDTALPTAPFLATGAVGERQRARLAQLLETLGAQGCFRLVAMHHSPLPEGHAWRKRLTDAGEVMAIFERAGAELVVHGHGHVERHDVVPTANGPMLVLGAPSASYRSDGRAGWNRYDISTEGRRWRVRVETRRWYEAEGLRTDATQVYRVGAESIPPQ